MKLQGSCHCGAVQFSVTSYTPYPFMYCYCSICRKTAGGGGCAVNIMGQADTLKVKGMRNVKIYRAKLKEGKGARTRISTGRRHFCGKCASALWISDPEWPAWVYPFASAIDTALPKPPERIHLMLNYVAPWCEIPKGKKEHHYKEYPNESIEHWHREHKLYGKK